MNPVEPKAKAALATLAILQLIMLGSLFAGIAPHPPIATPLFGIGPFIGLSLSVLASAVILGPTTSRSGRMLALLAGLMALVSFGPQKYFDAQFALIWPAVIGGQIAVLVLAFSLAASFRMMPDQYGQNAV